MPNKRAVINETRSHMSLFYSIVRMRFCGMLLNMLPISPDTFRQLYNSFDHPISQLDCGAKCAPFNERLKPFCCDIQHVVPSAYPAEWEYLRKHTELWHLWEGENEDERNALQNAAPEGHLLLECLGHLHCQRPFRSIACRSFPFFPYIDRQGNFIGLSYYWDFIHRCWVISNLDRVTTRFREEFVTFYDTLFELMPAEKKNFHHHSTIMRRAYGRRRQRIPLLHRDGNAYEIIPATGQMIPVDPKDFPKFEPYLTMAELPFPDEIE